MKYQHKLRPESSCNNALTLLLRTLQRRPDRVLKRTFEH
jgi:hypothetical protein